MMIEARLEKSKASDTYRRIVEHLAAARAGASMAASSYSVVMLASSSRTG